jgi:putative hydrolase of the HAD superfamily
MQQPKVIFLDAVGTLFGVRGSVGEIYGEIAREFGVEVSASQLNQAFYQSFGQSSPMVFPGIGIEEILPKEFEWWKAIAYQTFQQVGVVHQFRDFDSFFTQLYAHFASADPWFVYPDVLPALEHWHHHKIELGVLSNFDSRLYVVLKTLKLADFFTSITICTEVGAAKPQSDIFVKGLEKHDCPAQAAWHIGDSFKEDYQGAKAVGIRGIWLKRASPVQSTGETN